LFFFPNKNGYPYRDRDYPDEIDAASKSDKMLREETGLIVRTIALPLTIPKGVYL